MEFMTGVNKKETLEIGDLLTGSYEGKSVKVNGAVHTIRDMGEVAFIVLRKREGLLQCVYEEGKTQFDLKDLKDLVEATKDQDMTDAQVDEIKAAKEKLMTSAQNLFAKMYEATQGAGTAGAGPDMGAGAGADNAQGSAPYGDDVVDGDYKEV